MRRIRTIEDIARWRLCSGCGACVAACPEQLIRMVDIEDQGLRPVISGDGCRHCGSCVAVCPGIALERGGLNGESIVELRQDWGCVLEVWEGYACDPEIRYKGSSGGIATALAYYCLQEENFGGVLHTGTRPYAPLENVAVMSTSREELLAHSGSRYSPAAPCSRQAWIENAGKPCVFIGKPCDVAGLRKTEAVRGERCSRAGLAISIFCAATPSTQGTNALLGQLGVERDEVAELRYRGCGWPGATTVRLRQAGELREMTYEQAWGQVLSRHGQFRCRLCPDSTGEFADISTGDAWHRRRELGGEGLSLVLVRSERGRELLCKARAAGYVHLEHVDASSLPRSQSSLLNRRRQLWGRLAAMRLSGAVTPRYKGFCLFASWRILSVKDKARSVVGTLRRIMTRGLWHPMAFGSNGEARVGTAGEQAKVGKWKA